ncbi:MAG: type ISP restriction/modification enzyme [Phenylobacterium sp.]
MNTEALRNSLKDYARRIREQRRAHPDVTEPGLAGDFKQLLDAVLPHMTVATDLTVLPEFINKGVGRPDIALKRAGELARAFIELKALDKPTDGTKWTTAHDKRQFERFSEFAVWATCNFHEFRLYERGESRGRAALVPEDALAPDQADAAADKLVEAHDPTPALQLIERLAQSDPPQAKDAEHLAELLAHSARLVRGIVKDRLGELADEGKTDAPLQQVRKEFRDVLYSHPEAAGYSSSDFDQLFSAAFAQTLAFGLLLVREATGAPVDHHAAEHMPPEHPLMRTALRVLSMNEVAQEVGAGFDVMLQTVNGFDPAILAVRKDGSDPILYFYEHFLETFDPEARERYGVYYTPTEVVRFMVGALDRALKVHLKTEGVADSQVHILDPASGTGTFLLGVADRLRRNVTEAHGPGQVPAALRGLAKRMYGFELLIGPYAVAHYRLHHALSRKPDGSTDPTLKLPRLGIYLTDTLAKPGTAAALGSLGFVSEGIQDERKEADRVKDQQQILAILGNPPYRRLEAGENRTLVGAWVDEMWEDLKAPVSDAGHGNQLNTFPELSVAFWRWAIWKLFESPTAPKRGVIAFITNRKFLTGWPYAGLRKMLRERFDRIEVVDLRGDVRRGERAGVGADQGVFNIQVGTCITLAIADGSKAGGELAEVTYNDAWMHGHMSRRAKLGWMLEGEDAGELTSPVEVRRGALDDMRPVPFLNGSLLSIVDCFAFASSGVETTRDHLAYGFDKDDLRRRFDDFNALSESAARELYSVTRKAEFGTAYKSTWDESSVREVSYRPLDGRTLYNRKGFVDWPRPKLQGTWGVGGNAALFAMPFGTGAGPAIWCHGSLPDRHAFSGRGGYAFPLYDRRPGHGPFNLKPELIAALTDAYGGPVEPEAVFDAILALLSASSYSVRFAEDLEDVFPHVPFPASRDAFDAAAALGADIRAIETFARPPSPETMKGLAVYATAATGPVAETIDYEDGGFALCADGSGRITGVPEEVWSFSVSGYRVLPRWLAARKGLEIDEAFVPQLRDVVGRIRELIDLFQAADSILDRTLEEPLSRVALGLAPVAADPVE